MLLVDPVGDLAKPVMAMNDRGTASRYPPKPPAMSPGVSVWNKPRSAGTSFGTRLKAPAGPMPMQFPRAGTSSGH